MNLPHVIGLMATTRSRRELAHRAVHQFFAQNYAGDLTLMIADDDQPSGASFTHNRTVPGRSLITLTTAERLPVKRNQMAREAFQRHPDTICIIWDDDDYHAPGRVQLQVEGLIANPGADGCVIHPFLYFDVNDRFVKCCAWPLHDTWPHIRTANSSLAFRKSFFDRVAWPEEHDPGSSWRQLAAQPRDKITAVNGGDVEPMAFCHVRWGGNHARSPDTAEPGWIDTEITAAAMRELLDAPLGCAD